MVHKSTRHKRLLILCLSVYALSYCHSLASTLEDCEELLVQTGSSQNEVLKIEKRKIKDLKEITKERDFHSIIFVMDNTDSNAPELKAKWILKSANKKVEMVAERFAYLVSKNLNLNLVPTTFLVKWKNKLWVMQRFIENGVRKSDKVYNDLLKRETKDIQVLKLFWFLLGQWDCGNENLFFLRENDKSSPQAIDNGAISIPTYVQSYGAIPFKKAGISESVTNDASLENPSVIDWCQGQNLEKELTKRKIKLNYKLGAKVWYNFKFFIKDKTVYAELFDTAQRYKLRTCEADVLDILKKLDKRLITEIFSQISYELVMLAIKEEVNATSIGQFESEITNRILLRMEMVKHTFLKPGEI